MSNLTNEEMERHYGSGPDSFESVAFRINHSLAYGPYENIGFAAAQAVRDLAVLLRDAALAPSDKSADA